MDSRRPDGTPARPSTGTIAAAAGGAALAVLLCLWPLLLHRSGPAPPPAAASPAPPRGGELVLFGPGTPPAVLPPRQTTVRTRVDGLLAHTRIAQTFRLGAIGPASGEYRFPLPPGAVVDHFRLELGSRLVEGRVEPRLLHDSSPAGPDAGQPGVFSIYLPDLDPPQDVVAEFEYRERLPYQDGQVRFKVPLTAPPAVAPSTTSAISLTADVGAGLPLAAVASSSHAVEIRKGARGRVLVGLARRTVPLDRDFQLAWTPDVGPTPRAALLGESRYGDRFLAVLVMPPSEASEAPQRMPREVIFLIDTSAAQPPDFLPQVKTAVAEAVQRLTPHDRLNVIGFADEASSAFETPRAAVQGAIDRALAFLDLLRPGGSPKAVVPALKLALASLPDPGRLRQLVLITGSTVADAAVPASLANRLAEARLILVQAAPHRPVATAVWQAAEAGRSEFVPLDDPDQPFRQLDALFRRLAAPLLTDLELRWSGGLPVDVLPAPLPDLFPGRPVIAAARIPEGLLDMAGSLELKGHLAGRRWRAVLTPERALPSEQVASFWAGEKITWLDHHLAGSADPQAMIATARQLALSHQLVSEYTRLAAVDLGAPGRLPAAPAMPLLHGREPLPQMAAAAGSSTAVWTFLAAAVLLVLTAGVAVIRRPRR